MTALFTHLIRRVLNHPTVRAELQRAVMPTEQELTDDFHKHASVLNRTIPPLSSLLKEGGRES